MIASVVAFSSCSTSSNSAASPRNARIMRSCSAIFSSWLPIGLPAPVYGARRWFRASLVAQLEYNSAFRGVLAMELVWIGRSCFRLRGRDATVITDPCNKSSGYNLGRATADLVTISNGHPHHNAAEEVAGEPPVLDGPGESEVSGLLA